MAFSLSGNAKGYVPLQTSPSWTTQGDQSSTDVALGDFDYDGDMDLASFSETNVLVYRNDNGNLNAIAYWVSQEGTSGSQGSVVWADIDNDHYPELFTDLGMYENNNGVLSSTAVLTNISSASTFTLGDINNDGYVDLVTGKTDRIEVYENVGGVMDDSPDWNTTEANSPGALALGDADHDGYMELAVGNKWDPIRIYDNVAGSISNVSMWNSTLTDYVGCLAWGDVANDHFPELYACTQPFLGGAPNRMYMNIGGALEQYPSWNSTATSYATDAKFADMNGDGYLDLAVSNVPYMSMAGLSLGQEMVYLNENGVLNKTQGWEGPYQDVSDGLDVGLINNDGYPDMVVASSSDILQTYPGRVLVYSGLSPNRSPVITSVSRTGEPLRTGDESTISVDAEDPDGDQLQYDFSVAAGNGTIVTELGSTAVWEAPDMPGSYTINITVSDGKGGFGYWDLVLDVWPNHSPHINGASTDPTQPKTGQEAFITVTASDLDGDLLQYSFTITSGNGTIVSQSGYIATWKAPDAPGNYTINITVSDGRGGFDFLDLSVIVVEAPPGETPFFSLGNIWLLLLLAILAIVIVAVVVIAMKKRRRKPATEEPPSPPKQEQTK